MKINNIGNIQGMMNTYKNQGVKNVETKNTGRTGMKDELKISSEAQDFQTVLNSAKKVGDIRQEKVNEIKDQVDSGRYKVDAQKIAEKMLHSARRI